MGSKNTIDQKKEWLFYQWIAKNEKVVLENFIPDGAKIASDELGFTVSLSRYEETRAVVFEDKMHLFRGTRKGKTHSFNAKNEIEKLWAVVNEMSADLHNFRLNEIVDLQNDVGEIEKRLNARGL